MWGVIRKRAAENRTKSTNAVPLQLRRNQNYFLFINFTGSNNICRLLAEPFIKKEEPQRSNVKENLLWEKQEWEKFDLVKNDCVAEVQLGLQCESIICSAETKTWDDLTIAFQKTSLSFSGCFTRNDTFKKLKNGLILCRFKELLVSKIVWRFAPPLEGCYLFSGSFAHWLQKSCQRFWTNVQSPLVPQTTKVLMCALPSVAIANTLIVSAICVAATQKAT